MYLDRSLAYPEEYSVPWCVMDDPRIFLRVEIVFLVFLGVEDKNSREFLGNYEGIRFPTIIPSVLIPEYFSLPPRAGIVHIAITLLNKNYFVMLVISLFRYAQSFLLNFLNFIFYNQNKYKK